MPRTPFDLCRYDDPERFERDARTFLMASEAANGLMLGLLAGLRAGEWERPYLARVLARPDPSAPAQTVLAALRTPPHSLVLAEPADVRAVELLADDLLAADADLPGVLGPEDGVRAFAAAWTARTGLRARLGTAQRIYRCDRVEPPHGVPGALRPAAAADRALVTAWLQGFHDDAHPGKPFDAAAAAERWLGSPQRRLHLWEAGGRPVSLAGAAGPTPNGIRISAVYTPPEHRRRGYASAAVAEMTTRLLAEGRAFCTLYTDLANPTSNKIYRQIGYRPVLDAPHYVFEPGASGTGRPSESEPSEPGPSPRGAGGVP